MKNSVSPIPEGYNSITPYLIVNDGQNAIEFYKNAFNATELLCVKKPDGKVGHAELQIGDSKIMLGEECPETHARSPQSIGGSPVGIHLYVEDVDTIGNQAVNAGAKVIKPIQDMFYGDRIGAFQDPFGHIWYISTHIEDVSDEELMKRVSEASKYSS